MFFSFFKKQDAIHIDIYFLVCSVFFPPYDTFFIFFCRSVLCRLVSFIEQAENKTLEHAEFLRSFEQHILPKGFVKIRHAGYLHAKNKMERIASICKQLKLPSTYAKGSHAGCLTAAVANR